MPGFTDDILSMSGIEGKARTPAADTLFDIRVGVEALDADRKEQFHSLVAKLLYLAKRTRPDILLPVSFLSTRVNTPTVDDHAKLIRLLKYLNGTKDLGIMLRASETPLLEAYVDASYGVHADGKSHTGMMISLGGGPVHVRSTKQKIVTKSSTEAELVALSDSGSIVIWTRNFLLSQGEKLGPAKAYQDNQSTMSLVERGASASERTRHIGIRYFWIKDRVDSKEIEIEYLETDSMIADVLTKPLQGNKFEALRTKLLNWCP